MEHSAQCDKYIEILICGLVYTQWYQFLKIKHSFKFSAAQCPWGKDHGLRE